MHDAELTSLQESIILESNYTQTLAHPSSIHNLRLLCNSSAGDMPKLRRWIKRLVSGELPEYIIGRQQFRGRFYKADRRAYVSQPDSECLVEQVLYRARKFYSQHNRPVKICEVGAGGGILSISISLETDVPVEITCLDIDAAALEVATHNAGMHGVNLNILESDCLEAIKDDGLQDIIFAYPPWGDDSPCEGFSGSDWEHFHSAVPQLSSYPFGGFCGIHEKIIADAKAMAFEGDLIIYNDVLPSEHVHALCRMADRFEVVHPEADTSLIVLGFEPRRNTG